MHAPKISKAVNDVEMTEALFRAQRWMATLAHELRAPLSVVMMSLDLLAEDGLCGSSLCRCQNAAKESAQQMADIIEDILDLCRCRTDKLKLDTEIVDLNRIIAVAVRNAHTEVTRKQHRLTISLPAEPLRTTLNPTRTIQILTNLLINAAKYTKPGGDILLAAETNHQSLCIRVRDNGMGIPGELLDHIFDTYWQAPSMTQDQPGGLGIGLSLVKSLVELQGGTIRAFSKGLDQGTEFVLRLPCNIPPDCPIEENTATASINVGSLAHRYRSGA